MPEQVWAVSTWAARGETEPRPVRVLPGNGFGNPSVTSVVVDNTGPGGVFIKATGVDVGRLREVVVRLAAAVRTGVNSPETIALLGEFTEGDSDGE